MYADAFGLLVFGPFLTSASLSKNKFFDRLASPEISPGLCLLDYLLQPLPQFRETTIGID